MQYCFHFRNESARVQGAVTAVTHGAEVHGDRVIVGDALNKELFEACDGVVLFGIAGQSREIFDAYRDRGKHTVLIDKGYTRGLLMRIAVDAFQPLAYFQKTQRPLDRYLELKVRPGHYKRHGSVILFDGASFKYCHWHKLGEVTQWGADIVEKIKQHSRLPIVYRPRPSHNPLIAVPGAELSQVLLEQDLDRAKIVVSYGGNMGWDAVLGGVPHFAIGDSIARPISETDWSRLDEPFVPNERVRLQWFADVAYCQWSMKEIYTGDMWKYHWELLHD